MNEEFIRDKDRLFLTANQEWFGVDIRGRQLKGIDLLWVWAEKQLPICDQPPRGGNWEKGNSHRITPDGDFTLQDRIDDDFDPNRIWIQVNIAGRQLEDVDFLLLNTENLPPPFEGWDKSRLFGD